MIVNIIIAVLAYFLAGAFPILGRGLVPFVIWLILIYVAVSFLPRPSNETRNPWLY